MKQRAQTIKARVRQDAITSKRCQSEVANASLPILTRLSKAWKTNLKQQDGRVYKLLCSAFDVNYTTAEIAMELRLFCWPKKPIDKKKKTSDKEYNNTVKTIGRIKKKYLAGDLEKLRTSTGKEKFKLLRSKTMDPRARGRKPTEERSFVDEELLKWMEDCWKNEKRVTRTTVFRKALEINPELYGGAGSEGFLGRMKNWFYYSFAKKHNLSCRKIASVGQKLPNNWQEVMVDFRGRLRHRQDPQTRADGSTRVAGVEDAYYINTDHVPVWIESVGNYSWGKKDSGRRTVKTGGKEKDRFTAQLSIGKGGKKLIPFVIWNGELPCILSCVSTLGIHCSHMCYVPATPVPAGKKCGNRASVTYQIRYRDLDACADKEGNKYPPRDKIYMTVTKTANSNQDLTKLILKKVILPGAGAVKQGNTLTCDHKIGVLWDEFRAHSCPAVKSYCQSFDFLDVLILPGGLTPEGQPLDKVINKVFKGYFRDFYDQYTLNVKLDDNGRMRAPSRQLLAQWIVKAWEMVPEELVRKSWTACGYPSQKELESNTGAIVPYSESAVSDLVGTLCGLDARTNFHCGESGPEPYFSSSDEADSGDEVDEMHCDD